MSVIAELKSAFSSGEVVGEINKMSLQKAYLKASNKLCHANTRMHDSRRKAGLNLAAKTRLSIYVRLS